MALFLMTLQAISLSKIACSVMELTLELQVTEERRKRRISFNQKERFLKAFFQMQNGHRKLLLYIYIYKFEMV